ncbi:Histone_H3 [Hexamita inflata]|uniref:Histone H3 n=1 Tax=Hexamita inflata TaxID=28002 RepID=A0AA86QW32_9EUKA|nr:Histone H3 [Hexamita inflata]
MSRTRSGQSKITKMPRKTSAKKAVIKRSVRTCKQVEGQNRLRPGQAVKREIRQMQRTCTSCIPRASFAKVIKEVSSQFSLNYRYQTSAIDVLQEACENIVVQMLSDTQLIAEHTKRLTIYAKDVQLYLRIVKPQWAQYVPII